MASVVATAVVMEVAMLGVGKGGGSGVDGCRATQLEGQAGRGRGRRVRRTA